MMPGIYPPDVECCIEEPPGTDCLETVAHSAIDRSDLGGTVRYFFCAEHWKTASPVFKQAFTDAGIEVNEHG